VLGALELFGPGTGLETLRGLYPEMARGELQDLLRRYRSVYSTKHPVLLGELKWLVPGAVWAMDHAWLPEPIDGILPYALAVRDLSSGYQLLWQPVEDLSAATTVRVIENLFELGGPPLVLKSDGGPGFISEPTQDLLQRWGSEHLLSPPYWPRYNGSIESSIRWLKERTEYQATRAGHPGYWSAEDMDRAQWITNHIRHGRKRGRSAAEAWADRPALTPLVRQAFSSTVSLQLERAKAELGIAPEAPLGRKEDMSIKRTAISRALVAHGFLQHRRRRIPLPIKSLRAAKIS
jgi:hypothetical protein